MQELSIAAIQTTLSWENPVANHIHFGQKIDSIDRPVDIVLLPEMFSTGFSMTPQPLAETMTGPTIEWMHKMAEQLDSVVAGSVIIQENNQYFNRFLFVRPSGEVEHYDKRHLFTLAGEHKQYTGGHVKKTVDVNGWRIRLNVCYDLRFPVWARNESDYDVLLYVANWPMARVQAWSTLLRARSIENLSYVIGVNRIGQDANNNSYNGQSAILDMAGTYLAQGFDHDEIIYAKLSYEKLVDFRTNFPFHQDADDFSIS